MEFEPYSLPATLTTPQREAILHQGSPLLIIAGPGSGKTEVIAWRVAHLVEAGLAKPENILATTFTNKAALELKDRIQSKLPGVNVELMQVSTIHSFCADLLRRYPRQANLPGGFRILDETGQFLFVYSHRKELGLDERVKGLEDVFYGSVISAFNRATEEQVAPENLAAWCEENLSRCNSDETRLWQEREAIAAAYKRYCQLLLEEENLLDFAFLQTFALRLLEGHPAVLEELRQKYPEILVDEYQDTNAAQEKLLKLLAGDGQHLTVVGDDDQSIYRFRGATVRNILKFTERYPDAKVVKLVHNFRSREQIVDHSQQVIANNPARFDKDLVPVRGPGSEVLLVYERTAGEEAAAVIDLLVRLRLAGQIARYGDIAILLRSVKSYAEPYVNALISAGIPFQVIGDGSFFEHPEIAQLFELIRFLGITKPDADIHVRSPLFGLSQDTCESLKAYKGNLIEMASPEGLASIGIQPGEDQKRLLDLLELKQFVQSLKQESLLEVFYKLLAATGCAARFERQGNLEALSNLGIFSRLVAAWDEGGTSRNFYPFMEYLKLVRKRGLDPFLPPVEDSVRVMTIHQAKGLEFPVVVLGTAMDGRLPAMRRKDPYEIPVHLRASGEPEVSDPHLVDERKLFYVAATRARDLLIVGTADLVNKRGGGPSPFLVEMFGPDLHSAAAWSLEKVKDIESRAGKTQEPRPRHSFSELALYLQCPVRYKFAHVYGLEIPRLEPVQFGANVHRALEAIHERAIQGDIPSTDEIPGIVEAIWVHTRRSGEVEAGYIRTAIQYLQSYVREHREDLERSAKAETPFSFSLAESVLLGKIDLVRKDAGGTLELVDFKTSKPALEDLEHAELQLSLYGLGVEAGLGEPVSRLSAHFLGKEQKLVSWEWDEARRQAAQERLSGILEAIAHGQFEPNRAYCARCQEFQAICPYPGG